jgi:uncharacterized protein
LGNTRDTNYSVDDGFFELKFQEDGVFLTVNPPVGKGRRVDVNNVIDKLNRKRIKSFNRETVEYAVIKSDKVSVRIADNQEEAKVDASVSVLISPDRMKAFLSVIPPEGGNMLTKEEMLDLVAKNAVIHGVNAATLDNISRYPVYNEMVCIAEGTLPANGQNGKVEFFFDVKKEHKPTILEDGRVDFRELNLIESVVKGQRLCGLIPPLPGTPGRNVMGGEIPALDGKPAVLPRGRNVGATDDGQYLISGIDGQATFIDGKVSVFSNYEVPVDVDNSTGNISFVGNVSVRGNVLSGFTIEAGGNVEVWGVVEGAVIKAGGDIILRRGMQGLGKGTIISGGDIIARYIEHSNVDARNNVKAEAIMHSNIKCGNTLELSGKKGLLVGGTCKVGREISAKVIGSHMATVTDIEVGVDPSLKERYKTIRDESNSMESDIKKADQAITILKRLEIAGALTPEKQEMMVKSIRTKVFLANKINELREELTHIEAKLQQDAQGKIRCAGYIYPGTKVAIGTCMLYVKETLQYCSLFRDGADIRVGAVDK